MTLLKKIIKRLPRGTDAPKTVFDRTVAAAVRKSGLRPSVDLVARGTVPVPPQGRTVTTLQDYINHTSQFWAGDFGVIGDGVADDTVAFQYALDQASAYQRVLYCGMMQIKISGPIICTDCVGIVFEKAGFGNPGDPGIKVTGTGYTALTLTTAIFHQLQLAIYGTGNTCNGLYLQTPLFAKLQTVRVYNLDGFGVKIDSCFDCLFDDISIELCGNASEYAFSMNGAGNTCNMTHILRLQVELANINAIFIDDGNTLCCVFDSIHSERATVVGSGVPTANTTWMFGGGNCTYNNIRVEAISSGASGYVWARGANCVYQALRTENGVQTCLAADNSSSITLIEANITGTVFAQAGQSGQIVFIGGDQATIQANWTGTTNQRVMLGGVGGLQLKTGILYPGVGVQPVPVVVNVAGLQTIGDAATICFALITTNGGECAIFALIPGNTVLVSAASGPWSTVGGTAAKINVYWTGAHFELQNNGGSARAFYFTYIGSPINM